MSPSESPLSPQHPGAGGTNERWWIAGLVVILVLLACHFSRGLYRPWTEEDNWYGAVYSQAAHNNLRGGVRAAGVPATLYFGPLPIPPEAYYVHHPTLLPVLVTGSFVIHGECEAAARLVPVVASLASVLVLWLFLRGALGARAATLGAAVFAAVPMELHYGDMVDFEPVLTCWMLTTVSCVWRWGVTARPRWAVGATLFAALALWTDWPGYLLILSTAAWLIFLAPRRMRWLGWLFLGLVGCAGLLFLWQIRSVNAAAWSDLWTALQMRLDNAIPTSTAPITDNAPRFTWGDWLWTIAGDLRGNFLALTGVFVLLGVIRLIRERKRSEGLRWLGLAVVLMSIAGTLYVVLLRNESFIHDFAPFYLIGAVAILAGLGLDAVCAVGDRLSSGARLAVHCSVILVVLAMAWLGWRRSEEMRSPYLILDGQRTEPASLIPALGRVLGDAFPANATILANFDPYGSALTYYAQHPILTNLLTAEDWRGALATEHPAGGVIWLGAPGASELVASLPGEVTRIEAAGFSFALWRSVP